MKKKNFFFLVKLIYLNLRVFFFKKILAHCIWQNFLNEKSSATFSKQIIVKNNTAMMSLFTKW